jgi:hypothetical protein
MMHREPMAIKRMNTFFIARRIFGSTNNNHFKNNTFIWLVKTNPTSKGEFPCEAVAI